MFTVWTAGPYWGAEELVFSGSFEECLDFAIGEEGEYDIVDVDGINIIASVGY